jgi:Domain of unknown function (DUF1902)
MSKDQTTRQRTFYVRSVWDDEAGVFYSESDITGLHIEAQTLDEFEVLMHAFVPDLIVANHIDPIDFGRVPLRDLIPAWQWLKPDPVPVAA